MKEYYSKRAQEYEKIYHRDDPVRHAELAEISRLMQELFFRLDVLEVACGTGYWTERIARSARSVTAVDISEETLRIARQKNIEGAEVRFIQGTHIVRTRSTASSTRVAPTSGFPIFPNRG
ncbi:MAG TPA: methyltransferase domain-containing protein [Thermoclostridium sp.]|nr:methyltransferase domain-containing protein [Thermoclostridium sp.]HPU45638.1 methyltransferase domain-containing protein [Thermoclostridium sp.]